MSCGPAPRTPLHPLRVTRGATKEWLFSVYRLSGATRTPADITGSKVWFTVKNRIENVSAVIAKRNSFAGGVDNQILILVPQTGLSLGKFRVRLDPADTNGLDPCESYWCDAWVQLPGGPPIDRAQVMGNRELIIDPAVTTTF